MVFHVYIPVIKKLLLLQKTGVISQTALKVNPIT